MSEQADYRARTDVEEIVRCREELAKRDCVIGNDRRSEGQPSAASGKNRYEEG